MPKLNVKPGSADVSLLVFCGDTTSATGGGKTGLLYTTAGLACYYARPGAAAAPLALATQTVAGAHSDGGFVEVDAANLPGIYRLDLSDAVVAVGARSAVVMLRGAAGLVPLPLEIDLNPEVNVTHVAGTAQTAGDVPASLASLDGLVDTIDGVVDTIAGTTAKLDTALESDALVYRFTAHALEQAPGLDATGMRAAIGMADANLDTQLAALPTDADVNAACDTAITDAGVPAAVWACVVDGSITAAQAMRGMIATLLGKVSGAGTTTITFRDAGDTKARVTATVDGDGNRTAITKDLD